MKSFFAGLLAKALELLGGLKSAALAGLTPGFWSWLAGLAFDFVVGKLKEWAEYLQRFYKGEEKIEENQKKTEEITKEAQTIIDKAASEGRELTPEEEEEIRKKKVAHEEDAFNNSRGD